MSINLIILGGVAIALMAIFIIGILLALKFVKKFVIKLVLFLLNSFSGIVLLIVVVYVFGIDIPLNIVTILITAVFGLAGIGTLLLLHLGAMI